jgi:aspartyl-tRNA(Asn)/glutamyl-tRNA(Gln) amidotransferase subunit C
MSESRSHPEQLSADDVRRVARLARLELTDEQAQRYASQLASILGYVAKISTADLEDVQPMAHAVPLHNVFRDDVVGAMLPLEDVLRNAPDVDGPFFKVPKVIGGDEDSAG